MTLKETSTYAIVTAKLKDTLSRPGEVQLKNMRYLYCGEMNPSTFDDCFRVVLTNMVVQKKAIKHGKTGRYTIL